MSMILKISLRLLSDVTASDYPHTNDIPQVTFMQKWKTVFLEKLLCIVDRYVIPEQLCSHMQPIQLSSMLLKNTQSNPYLHRVLLEHDYTKVPPTAVSICTLPPSIKQKLDRQEASRSIQETETDGVLDYAAAIYLFT